MSERYELETFGRPSLVYVDDNQLTYENESGALQTQLPADAAILTGVMLSQIGKPMLASHVRNELWVAGKNDNFAVNPSFDSLYKAVEHTNPFVEHLIRIGRGKATWYGVVESTSVESKVAFAKEGIAIIESSRSTERLEKRVRPFYDFIDFVEGRRKDSFAHRHPKVFGTIAVSFTIGSMAAVYVVKKHRHEP